MCGSFLKSSRTISCTLGIRVEPPTRTTSSISFAIRSASCMACLQGPTVLCSKSSISCSSFERLRRKERCFGPDASAVINGRLISVSSVDESSIFAFSAASLSRCNAIRSLERSIPWSLTNSSMIQSMIL